MASSQASSGCRTTAPTKLWSTVDLLEILWFGASPWRTDFLVGAGVQPAMGCAAAPAMLSRMAVLRPASPGAPRLPQGIAQRHCPCSEPARRVHRGFVGAVVRHSGARLRTRHRGGSDVASSQASSGCRPSVPGALFLTSRPTCPPPCAAWPAPARRRSVVIPRSGRYPNRGYRSVA